MGQERMKYFEIFCFRALETSKHTLLHDYTESLRIIVFEIERFLKLIESFFVSLKLKLNSINQDLVNSNQLSPKK